MSVGIVAVALAVAVASVGAGQVRRSECERVGVPVESLRSIASRLHPEALADSSRTRFLVVALVFDSRCELVEHAVGHRAGLGQAPGMLATVVAGAAPTQAAYSVTGFAELTPRTADEDLRLRTYPLVDLGLPWIVWGVQRATGRD